ncbi:MAG TPA: hypothetical protein VFV96_16975 [Verrucomicrobiae bacterium]|nr:hypothetical protein [Verrucomicrobiae bacterium]
MNADAYWYVLGASLAGGVSGALVMWHRRCSQRTGESTVRRLIVLTAGTVAFGGALFAFTRAFGQHSPVHAVLVMVLVTAWVAVLQSAMPLPVPATLLRVNASEFAVLRFRWMGVRGFGGLLRRTPLRHLGGTVYLVDAGRQLDTVLRGIYRAEAVHLWAAMSCVPWLAWWAAHGQWSLIVWGVAVQLPLNVYPVLHLRYVTWRLQRHAARWRR